ncbi:hypothetical protein C9I57_02975 [Trinickia symbiotica]|uniref:Uncharacterized protein n=1 Tax=Trinickia symbiotica TaxID=863227 RepID=A0A2T3Y1V2_9BURK|nr:hypothetical protein C9I57_02975 [Trinickia symbiotica]
MTTSFQKAIDDISKAARRCSTKAMIDLLYASPAATTSHGQSALVIRASACYNRLANRSPTLEP